MVPMMHTELARERSRDLSQAAAHHRKVGGRRRRTRRPVPPTER